MVSLTDVKLAGGKQSLSWQRHAAAIPLFVEVRIIWLQSSPKFSGTEGKPMNDYIPAFDSAADVPPMIALTVVAILWGFVVCSAVVLASGFQ
jgi:hypothetical protein